MVGDSKLLTTLKAKIYKTAITPVLLYSIETMAIRKANMTALEGIEIRMLRWIGTINLREKKMKLDICRYTSIENMTENAKKHDSDSNDILEKEERISKLMS